jgi:hypothetical protein
MLVRQENAYVYYVATLIFIFFVLKLKKMLTIKDFDQVL